MLHSSRLIPLVLVAASLLLATKLGFIWRDAGVAFAEPAPKADASATDPATAKPAATDPAAKPAAGDAQTAKGTDMPAAPNAAAKPQEHFSAAEVELLQELSKRRAEIEKRGEDMDRREALLKATEQRVDDKITHLQQLQTAVDAAVGKSEQQDDQKITSLVRIYETMKPADAARIFEGMEMPPLLQLLTRMKELKTAPILAAMAPEKARAVTVAMAQRKEIPDVRTN